MLTDPLVTTSSGGIALTSSAPTANSYVLVKDTDSYREYRSITEGGSPLIRSTSTFRVSNQELSNGRRRIGVSLKTEFYDVDNGISYPYVQVTTSWFSNGAGRYPTEDTAIANYVKVLAYLLANTETTPTGIVDRLIKGEM